MNLRNMQTFSHHALSSLFTEFSHVSFDRHGQSWQPAITPQSNAVQTLTIVGQHLNLHILQGVVSALPESTQFTATKHGLSGLDGLCAVVVSLSAPVSHEWVNEQAQRFYVDIFAQQHQPSMAQPGVMVMDMDSTVIQIECIDEIAKLAGRGEEVSAVTELAMQGKLDFAQSLHERVACLQGVPAAQLAQIRDAIPLMPGITTLVTELQQRGWHIAIASGGFTYFADYVAARLGLVEAVANQLDIQDGVLTGKLLGPISDAQTKDDTLKRLAQSNGIAMTQTIALGDGANDLVMMRDAGLGMAYRAKPLVQAQAQCSIRHHSLAATLFAMSFA
jgi:phosphoserine phosphatase